MENSFDGSFSIIIPTYNEVKNIPLLVETLAKTNLGTNQFEVILVDDNSQDGSRELANTLSITYPWLKFIERRTQRNLSLSILDGFAKAQFPNLVTMDADLSHPPELIIELINHLTKSQKVDLVIGSRYITGGSTDPKWPAHRKLTSRLSALLTQILLCRKVKDPLSGFIAIKKSTFARADTLNPIGWKIGLELLIKCHCKHILEVPIHFSERVQGSSKLNQKIALQFFLHLALLFQYQIKNRVARLFQFRFKLIQKIQRFFS